MRMGMILAVAGLITAVFGGIFHLQGQAIVGPEESFMYSNPDWITYGIQIITAGVLLCGAGVLLTFLQKR